MSNHSNKKHSEDKVFNIGLVPDFRMLPPAKGGIGVYSLSLIAELNKIEGPYRYKIFIDRDYCKLLPRLSENIEIITVKTFSANRYINTIGYFFFLPLLARKYRIDLLHLFAGNRRLSLFSFSKTVVTVHDFYHYYSREIYSLPRFLYCKYMIAPLLRICPNIISVSRSTKFDLQTYLNISEKRIRVIENGYDGELYRVMNSRSISHEIKKKYDLKKGYILYVSVLDSPRKNHLKLIKAYTLLKDAGFNLDLLLVGGEFWNQGRIYREIKNKGFNKCIRVLGYVPDKDLAMLYNDARILVHPSGYEGFGLPIVEAMASGLPVACSDIPTFREIGGDAPIFFNPDDVDEMADRIRMLCENEGLYETCRSKGLERVRQFDWSETAKAVTAMYRDILMRSR